MAKYIITSIPQKKFPTGGTVSQRWEAVTGTPWAEAKQQGFTTGSFDDNIALLKKLNSGDFDIGDDLSKKVSVSDPAPSGLRPVDPTTVNSIKNANSFNEAFTIARSALGSNHIFEWRGRKYGTNLKGETFNPSAEVLSASGMNTPKVKSRIANENKDLNSPYISKTTVKLQPDPYEDWEEIKKKNQEINKKSNADKILSYKKKTSDNKNFLIVDKQKGLLHIYDPKGTQLFSSAIDLGALQSDAQTVTKYKDLNKDGKITGNEVNKNNVDWSAGNLSTGAGKFYISNIDNAGYEGLPILNMMNESQYNNYLKTGKVENVSTSFHKGYVKDDNSRVSNGCIRCSKTTLDNLTKYLQNSSEVYILPEDKGNEFVYENGKLNFRVNPQYDYNTYTDYTGKTQKGQGVNRTENTLNYKPIKVKFDEDKFRSEIFTATDIDDEDELKKTKQYINALQDNKQSIMKAAKINGDVYNEIAKIAFGIYGTETNYADTHSGITNAARAVNKWLDPSNASSPDYESKYDTYGADEDYRSVGLTQIRWNYLNEDEKKALKAVGITSNADFMNPQKAAIGTAVILGVRYNQQLTSDQKKDIWAYLPTKWNTRDNYADRVKNNSRFLTIYQYTGSDKPTTKSSTTKKVIQHKPTYGTKVESRNQYHPKLNPSPADATYVNRYVPKINIPKTNFNLKQPVKPVTSWLDQIYKPMFNYNTPSSFLKPFEEGGYVETDIPDEAIQDYVNRGYIVEEVNNYSDGGIFRRRRNKEPLDYTTWSGTAPQIVQPGEDPFALPTYPSGPAPEFTAPDYESMFPGWTPEEIDQYYVEKEAYDKMLLERQKQAEILAKKRERLSAYKPVTAKYKELNRPKANFVLAEDMSKEFLKTLKDSGFYALKTKSGDYEVFSNKDIADLIYKKGITPTELATEFKLGDSKTLKSYFQPVYTNASLIHAKRNKEKIDNLISDGNTKTEAINKLVKQGEGTVSGLTNLYGSYTQAAYDKNKAEVDALTSMGVADTKNLTDYQRQMYLNINNFAKSEYDKQVGAANEKVASWAPYSIMPAESTAMRNKTGFTDPLTGEYVQADNRTSYEVNEDNKFLAQKALEKYNQTTAMQADAAKAILGSQNLTDEQRKKFLENPDEFNKILKQYVDWKYAPEGEAFPQDGAFTFNDPYVRVTPGSPKSEFNITPEGAKWTPGSYTERRTIDGPVQMVYPEKYFMGPGAGLVGMGFRGMTKALEYPLLSAVGSEAAPWLTGGNILNAYMGYETLKPEGLIDQSIQGFKEGDNWKAWGNAGMSALNLLPFVGPTAKTLDYLADLGRVENVADAEGITQAGMSNWFKGTGSSSIVDANTLKTLKANNYQGASDDILTALIQKAKGDAQKSVWQSTITPEESLILNANKERVSQLAGTVEAPTVTQAAPTGFLGKTYQKGKDLVTGTASKIGTGVSTPAKNWWETYKTDMANASWLERFAPIRAMKSTAPGSKVESVVNTTAAQNTTKYLSMDEIAQSMYGSKYDDLSSSLAKLQVEKAFKAQPLPSGASTSAQGAASNVTSASDDILLKNKIANEKYGVDYDKLTGWAPSVVDKEFQAAKTLQQDASAALQTKNAAEANAAQTSTQTGSQATNSGVQFSTTTPRFELQDVGTALTGLYQRGKYWDDAGTKGDELLNKDMLKFHGTYSGRPIVEIKMPDGSSEFFYKSVGDPSKGGAGKLFGRGTTEGMWQPFGGFSNTPTTKNWFIKDAGYKDYYGSNTFKSIAENLDDALKKKFELKSTKDLDNALNFQNRNGAVDSFTPMSLGIVGAAGAMGEDDNSNYMLATLPLAFMTKGKAKLTPSQLKYLKLATSAATEVNPLKNAAVMSADASNIKTFLEGEAINKGLTGAAKQTEGAFNMGVFNVKNEPGLIAKIENPGAVGAARGMPDYQYMNMTEAMQNISGPTFGKVHHQVVSPTTGNRALILNKLEGTPYNELTMDDYLGLSDDAIVKFHDDIQELKRNNLGFDFEGNNYLFDRNTNQFKLFDIDPHTTNYDPYKASTFDFFQDKVYGGGNPLLYGSKQAGLNLQHALRNRLLRDINLKSFDAGVEGTDAYDLMKTYDDRLFNILKGLNYEEDGGFVETDVDPDMLENLIALGYDVQQV